MKQAFGILLAALLASLPAGTILAQDSVPTQDGASGKLAPDDEAKQEVFKQKWQQMTPAEQEAAKEKIRAHFKERYDNASPEEQARMRGRVEEWHQDHQVQGPDSQDVDSSSQAGQETGIHLPSSDQ